MLVKKLETGESMIKPPASEKLKFGYVVLNPGEEVGEHVTKDREEVILILSGTAVVVCDGEEKAGSGHAVYISPGKKHNVINNGKEVLKYVYFVCLK